MIDDVLTLIIRVALVVALLDGLWMLGAAIL